MRTRVKRTILIVVSLIFFVFVILISRAIILNKVKQKIQDELVALNEKGYQIQYDTIYLDWRRNLMVVDKFVLQKNAYDTACLYPEFLSANQLRLKGFRLFTLLFKKTLSFESFIINEPHIVVRKHSDLLPDSTRGTENPFALIVDEVRVVSAHVEYTDSASCTLLTDIKTDIQIADLDMAQSVAKPFRVSARQLAFFNAAIQLPEVYYHLSIRELRWDFTNRTLELDTMKISPQLSKLAFGRTVGREIDRIEGVIPYIKLKHCDIGYSDSVNFRATYGNIQGFMKFFRDKRLVHKRIWKPLPVAHLRRLPFGLRIDTLAIEKSYVEYEEFPEESQGSGRIFFDDLTGRIIHLDNDTELRTGKTIVDARARFMGVGDLRVHTVFPWRKDDQCLTEGQLGNMNLQRLNPMLEPMANMKIESGDLERLTFRFAYDAIRSNGEVELKYRDLKIISFKEQEKIDKQKKRNRNKSEEDLKKDNLKTFILNTFVIRKNMTDKAPDEKRTGQIAFERDTSRSIFNYWWKSVFSGIKSAYNMEDK